MKWSRWAASAALFAVLLSGCAPTAPQVSPTSPGVTAVANTDNNSADRSRVADGGFLRIPLTALPSAWNPWHPLGREADAKLVRAPISEPAFTFDAAGRPAPNPSYVVAVDVRNEGSTVVTLTLNPRAVWSDGAPITASDWISTWKALGGTNSAYQVADSAGWSGVGEVRAGTGAHEVVVTYRGIQPDWSRPLADGPCRTESIAAPETFNGAWPEYKRGWFTGPYVVTQIDQTQGVVTLERNPLWWGDAPKLDHITFRTIQPVALTAAFSHNEFDWIDIGTSADRLARVRGVADTAIRVGPGSSGRKFLLDTTGVLSDPALRAVLVQALDRRAIASVDLGTLVEKPLLWGSHLRATNQPGYVDQAVATGLDHDRDAAATALTKAGWTLTDGHRTKNGNVLTLSMAVPSGDPWAQAEWNTVSTQLAELGVQLTATSGKADITPVTVTIDRYSLTGVQTISGTSLGDLPSRVASETDLVRRADLATQVERQLWLDAQSIPIFQLPQVVAVRSSLANLGASGYATTRWEDVGWIR